MGADRVSGASTSPVTNSKGPPSSSSSEEPGRLRMHTCQWRSASRRAIFEPTKPVPPVINARVMKGSPRQHLELRLEPAQGLVQIDHLANDDDRRRLDL